MLIYLNDDGLEGGECHLPFVCGESLPQLRLRAATCELLLASLRPSDLPSTGETLFYEDHAPHAPELLRWRPLEGAALVHAHGDRCLTHEGAEVKRGVKYLLRTDLAYACVKPKPHRP